MLDGPQLDRHVVQATPLLEVSQLVERPAGELGADASLGLEAEPALLGEELVEAELRDGGERARDQPGERIDQRQSPRLVAGVACQVALAPRQLALEGEARHQLVSRAEGEILDRRLQPIGVADLRDAGVGGNRVEEGRWRRAFAAGGEAEAELSVATVVEGEAEARVHHGRLDRREAPLRRLTQSLCAQAPVDDPSPVERPAVLESECEGVEAITPHAAAQLAVQQPSAEGDQVAAAVHLGQPRELAVQAAALFTQRVGGERRFERDLVLTQRQRVADALLGDALQRRAEQLAAGLREEVDPAGLQIDGARLDVCVGLQPEQAQLPALRRPEVEAADAGAIGAFDAEQLTADLQWRSGIQLETRAFAVPAPGAEEAVSLVRHTTERRGGPG
ncbi:MAG: hypothetical protein DWQ36_04810 [Acidobacteria bacterium]|nr:MAG: hypothetical protein DWQ30_20670 [Acidobacteriota bacterium]REK10116.1 MAG: hypothetical protein DWQ36_04810 [Acidobacteriota bacterium]